MYKSSRRIQISRTGRAHAPIGTIPEGRPVSPPPTHPELEALGPAESARRLTPDRESMGGMETPVKTGELPSP